MEDFASITNEIKHREKSIVLNFLDIGRALIKVRENQLYKTFYSDMEKYINSEFSFNFQQGEKFMKVANEFSSLANDTRVTTKLGIEKLYLMTFVPEMKREELIRETIENEYTVKDLKKKVKEEQVDESYDIETNDETAEKIQKYYNQALIFLDEIDEVNSAFNRLQAKINDWLNETKRYDKLNTIREDLEEKWNKISIQNKS